MLNVQKNMGNLDRALRMIAGMVLIVIGILKMLPYSAVIIIFGAFVILTGIVGYCILYLPFGFSTRK